MKDLHLDQLISGFLDDTLSPQEKVEFESLMMRSEAARARFWELAEVHGLMSQAMVNLSVDDRGDWKVETRSTGLSTTDTSLWREASSLYRRRKSGVALVGGVLLGVLFSVFSLPVRGMPQQPKLTPLTAESFETGIAPAVVGIPTTVDNWSGDFTNVVASRDGLTPVDGDKMLQILRADYQGKPEPDGSYCGDLYRLIDVRSLAKQVATGDTVVRASAMFNMTAQPQHENFRHNVSIMAVTSDLIANENLFDAATIVEYSLASASRQSLRLDNDPQTWELSECELRLPPETEYVMVYVAISYGHSKNDLRRITFPGHFIDDIRVSLADYSH
ncbi:hypothetical protein AB1K70_18155 [Bremerella sp. JC770]|uniref:anti-sigma factor family protein n=1 Tax=Bremerella sp. JC770 TaxID=3232137 RepID=UPI003459C180